MNKTREEYYAIALGMAHQELAEYYANDAFVHYSAACEEAEYGQCLEDAVRMSHVWLAEYYADHAAKGIFDLEEPTEAGTLWELHAPDLALVSDDDDMCNHVHDQVFKALWSLHEADLALAAAEKLQSEMDPLSSPEAPEWTLLRIRIASLEATIRRAVDEPGSLERQANE